MDINFLEICGLRPCYKNNEFMESFKKTNIRYFDIDINKFNKFNNYDKSNNIKKKIGKRKKNVSYNEKCDYIKDYINHFYNIRDFSRIIEDYTSDEEDNSIEDDEYFETYFSD